MSQTIYVDRKFVKLTCEKKQLIFHSEEGRKATLPFRLIDRLVIQGHCIIDTYLLSKLAENSITTVLFSSSRAKQTAVINGVQHNDASIHIKQYRFYQSQSLQLSASKRLVKAKLLRQYRLVTKIKNKFPEHNKTCFDAQHAILTQLKNVDNARDNNHLLGIEGYAARQYFAVFSLILPENLNFNGRKKRPSPDPVNAMLSLSYTIFSSRCSQALNSVGLDPYIGFYHKLSYARESLAVDMIEPWRPLIDQFVSHLFKDKIILADYFDYKGTSCLLNKKGRSLFYPEFERKMKIWQKGINHMARNMVTELKNKIMEVDNIPLQYSLF